MNTRILRLLLPALLLAALQAPSAAQDSQDVLEAPSARITAYGASGWMNYGPDEMAILTTRKSVMLGVWHPSTRRYERSSTHSDGDRAGQNKYYRFLEDGSIWYEDLYQIGEIESDGTLQSAGTHDVRLAGDDVMIGGEKYGSITDGGAIYVLDDLVANCLGKVDKQTAAFIVFCTIFTQEYLDGYKTAKVELDASAEQARAQARAQAAANQQRQQQQPQQASGNRRHASYIDGQGGNVRALDGRRNAIGRTSIVGSDIYVYTGTGGSVSTGKIRRMGDGYTVDFRGSTNVYRIGKSGNDLVFYGSNGVSVGKVRHNDAMRRYEAQREGSTAVVAEFSDSIDPACAALLFYNFFD